MTIAAIVGVKDEADLIERALDHLRAIGVDRAVACDMHSTDGSAEILADRATRDDDLTVVQMSDSLSQEDWSSQTLALADATEAEWVLFMDADEFPLPASGSLRDTIAAADADVVTLERYNVPLSPHGPLFAFPPDPDTYPVLLLMVEPIPDFWEHVKGNFDASWMRSRIAPRVIARPEVIAELEIGGHDIVPKAPDAVRRAVATDAFIAHLPFTTHERFERKVDNIRALLATQDEFFGDRHALHWRRWVAIADEGKLQEEFARMVFEPAEVTRLRADGVVRSAAELLAEGGEDAQSP